MPELLELPKDIAFDKYDVLNDSENIKIFSALYALVLD